MNRHIQINNYRGGDVMPASDSKLFLKDLLKSLELKPKGHPDKIEPLQGNTGNGEAAYIAKQTL